MYMAIAYACCHSPVCLLVKLMRLEKSTVLAQYVFFPISGFQMWFHLIVLLFSAVYRANNFIKYRCRDRPAPASPSFHYAFWLCLLFILFSFALNCFSKRMHASRFLLVKSFLMLCLPPLPHVPATNSASLTSLTPLTRMKKPTEGPVASTEWCCFRKLFRRAGDFGMRRPLAEESPESTT